METISDRIKYIRTHSGNSKLTLEEFGKSLGISKAAAFNLENSERLPNGVPDSTIRLICSTYHVLYRWLTTGEGQMYEDDPQARIERIIEKVAPNASDFFKAQVIAYGAMMSDESWEIFRDIVEQVRAQKKE